MPKITHYLSFPDDSARLVLNKRHLPINFFNRANSAHFANRAGLVAQFDTWQKRGGDVAHGGGAHQWGVGRINAKLVLYLLFVADFILFLLN